MSRRRHEEASAQAAFVSLVREWQEREGYERLSTLHAIPNGEYRPPATAARLKGQGVLAGVCDLFLPARGADGQPGLYIEMKKAKGGRIDPAQRLFIDRVLEEGYTVEVCNTALRAAEVLTEYLGWGDRPGWIFACSCLRGIADE